jgi:IS5 family transposase
MPAILMTRLHPTHRGAERSPYRSGRSLDWLKIPNQALIGNVLERCIADAGYRGHNAAPEHKFKVYTTGAASPPLAVAHEAIARDCGPNLPAGHLAAGTRAD